MPIAVLYDACHQGELMKYLENIINSGLLREIKKSDYIDAFEQLRITSKSYAKNAPVFLEGDVIDRVCIVLSGSVRSEKNDTNGEIHIVEIFEENSIFGLEIAASKKRISTVDYISNEEATIIFVSMASILKSDYSTGIIKAILLMLADENIKMSHKIEILAERSLRGRILIYLDVLRKKSGSREVSVRMSREQFAQYLCVNRSALSNELNKMKREGIIDFKGSKFRILK